MVTVFMKNITDAGWTDVTNKIVKTNLSIREGFGSLGTGADLAKVTLTYKAADLATASVFHTTAKQVRIVKDGVTVFEGYTEGNATVQSSDNSDLAWVKLTAYPYINLMKGTTNDDEIVAYDVFACQTTNPSKSIIHILWNAMLNKLDSNWKTLISLLYTVQYVDIAEYMPVYRLDAGTSLYDEFSKALGEYSYVHWIDGFVVRFSKPYADDSREVKTIGFDDIITNPSIKTSPYKTKKSPRVTVSKILQRDNATVYELEDGIKDIAIGGYYPDEGNAVISYGIKDESDTLSFYSAKNPAMSYYAFRHDNVQSASLIETVKTLGSTEAEIRLQNGNDVMVDIKTLNIVAEKVYVRDSSLVLDADTEGEKEDISTTHITSLDAATEYINALVSERVAEGSGISFQSGKLVGIKPNDIIEIGDIPADYLVRYVDRNIITGISKYECVMLSLDEVSATVKIAMNNSQKKGKDGYDGEDGSNGKSYIVANVSVPKSYTLLQWTGFCAKDHVESWSNVANWNDYKAGDTLEIQGTISDLCNIRCTATGRVDSKSSNRVVCVMNGDLTYAENGDDAKFFNLKVKSSTFVKNLRTPSYENHIIVTVEKQGYDGDVTFATSPANYYDATNGYLKIPYNASFDSLDIIAYCGTESRSVTVTAIDETEYKKYLGDTTRGTVDLVGDCYYNSDRKRLEVKKSSGNWLPLNDASLGLTDAQISYYCSLAQRDVMSRIEEGSTIESDYAYFNTIIANCITANYIGSKVIEVQDGGVIKSKSYTEGTTGFSLSADGTSVFENVTVKGGYFDCGSFSSLPVQAGTSYTSSAASIASTQFAAIKKLFEDNSLVGGILYTITCSNTSKGTVAKVYKSSQNEYVFYKSGGTSSGYVIGSISYDPNESPAYRYSSPWDGINITFTIVGSSGAVFKFKNIPTSSVGLEVGQVYSDNGTLKIKT